MLLINFFIVNKEQAINILFATIEINFDNHKQNMSEDTAKLIDEAKDYVLRNLM